MAKRMQSPSSINLYKQCPRRYYFQYIEKLPTRPSIHLIRGNIVHSVLEDFFKEIPSDETGLRLNLMKLLHKHWDAKRDVLGKLGMTKEELDDFFIDSEHMVLNFSNQFLDRLKKEAELGKSWEDAFASLTPLAEAEFRSEVFQVRGFIDAIEEKDGKVAIVDYKTSKKAVITDAYKLQLAIYSLLYHEKHGRMPDKAGIFFLKDTVHNLDVDEELLKLAKFEIEQIHFATESDHRGDYPRKKSGLCKWHSGQCDFYDACNGR